MLKLTPTPIFGHRIDAARRETKSERNRSVVVIGGEGAFGGQDVEPWRIQAPETRLIN